MVEMFPSAHEYCVFEKIGNTLHTSISLFCHSRIIFFGCMMGHQASSTSAPKADPYMQISISFLLVQDFHGTYVEDVYRCSMEMNFFPGPSIRILTGVVIIY